MTANKFAFPAGAEVTLGGSRMILSGMNETGYRAQDLETGEIRTVAFQSLVDRLRLPGTVIDVLNATTGNRQKQRLGGYSSASHLSDAQRAVANFHVAICQAVQIIQDQVRTETGDVNFAFSISKASAARERIANVVSGLIGEKVHLVPPRGGKSKARHWYLYTGRIIMDKFKAFIALRDDESAHDELVPLEHLKGNRIPRITHRTRELMTQAWEEVGLNTKKPSVAAVKRHLAMLIVEENRVRRRNELADLITPSNATLSAHRDEMIGATAYHIATVGEREAKKRRGRGSTDIRALVPGEYVEIDECKASLIVSAKALGLWEHLGEQDKKILEQIDQEIRLRLYILVMIDVATRMPLAWVISDQPKAEATLALLRMATRDKEREARRFRCVGQAVGGIGIAHIKADNGPGLRNTTSVAAIVGCEGMITYARAHSPAERSYIERMFGTTENVLFRLIHGYTGRKPNDLPGYDAQENGVLDIEELMGILTRFMIDEYPLMRHRGIDMGGRRPIDVWNELQETRGCFRPLDPGKRRIQLGWEVNATPTDEGVRVFSGLWFNSEKFQEKLEEARYHGKVRVFVDPEDITCATVLIPKIKEPVDVVLQVTAFADLSLPEVLELLEIWRREDPRATEIYEDRLASIRRARHDQLYAIGVERKLKRSFSTFEECEKKARDLFRGARVIGSAPLAGTTPAGMITDLMPSQNTFLIGGDDMLIDGALIENGELAEVLVEAPEVDGDAQTEVATEVFEDPAPVALPRSERPKQKRHPSKKSSSDTINILLDPTQMRQLE
jgi:putative transposase